MGNLLQKLKELFASSKIEVVLIGLENSGKTTLLNQLHLGDALQTVPTIGCNIKYVKKGGVQMKIWDIGGQIQYRPEWGKYSKGCDIIIFMVDASDKNCLPISKKELQLLLEDKELNGIPILVLGNKIDIKPHIDEKEIIEGLNLDYIATNNWVVVMVSALKGINIPEVVEWLVNISKKNQKT